MGTENKQRTAAWFAGFVPAENPEYAFAALYEGEPNDDTVHGGSHAAPLVGKVFREIYKLKKERDAARGGGRGQGGGRAPERRVELAAVGVCDEGRLLLRGFSRCSWGLSDAQSCPAAEDRVAHGQGARKTRQSAEIPQSRPGSETNRTKRGFSSLIGALRLHGVITKNKCLRANREVRSSRESEARWRR